jgi:hypothetical protein
MKGVAMRTLSKIVGGLAVCALLCLAAGAADDNSPRLGTWSLNNWIPGDSVHLKLSYSKGTTRWQWGNDQPQDDLRGLTSGQLHAAHADVAFTLQRDAGTFAFTGSLMLGIGGGDFRFVPDPNFVAKLAELGYGPIDDDTASLMFMAARDISIDFAREVKRSGLKDVTVSDLVRLKDHGVSLEFIRTLSEIGMSSLTAEDVVRFRDHGIDGGFLRALSASGAPVFSADEIIKLHDHGVKPDYVARIHSAGYADLTADEIIRLHDHGVN